MSATMMLNEVREFPIDERVKFVDAVLRTIHSADDGVEAKWIEVANRRKAEIMLGRVETIPSDEVFKEAYALAR